MASLWFAARFYDGLSLLFLLLLLMLQISSTEAALFSEYILAPESRTVFPVSIYKINGTVANAAALLASSQSSSSATTTTNTTTNTTSTINIATISGTSAITFDFGKNIGGIISVEVANSTSTNAVIGVTFSESSMWISGEASDGTADAGQDVPLFLQVGKGSGIYSVGSEFQRGGFRYLSLVGNTTADVEVVSVSVDITFSPAVEDLRDYTGWFHSDDELLNRIWYAGAYTTQLCAISPTSGDSLVHFEVIVATETISIPETVTWWNNYTITNGTTASVDGAKRDRQVWPGDMSITMPSVFVSTSDMLSLQNSLDSLLILQLPNGRLPYVGVPLSDVNATSFTYHLFNLIAVANYYRYTGDVAYLQSVWDRFTSGIAWSLSNIDDSGLMNVTSSYDWLRVGMGGHNIEANAILYYTLNQGLELAAVLNDTSVVSKWTTAAEGVKTAANALLWNETEGWYHDNETTTLAPQDGNSWAIKSNLTANSSQIAAISSNLQSRWGQFGAPAPEAGSVSTVSPFIGGFELEAHFLANNSLSALDLMRLQWGFMLNDPRMTNSTWIEGYSADGSLHYAPYTNDPRVSHAHGWSTGPTFLLSFYTAGIQLTSASGATWLIAPQVGDLSRVTAGFRSSLGTFSNSIQLDEPNGTFTSMNFSTPVGTMGKVSLPGYEGILVGGGKNVSLVGGVAEGLAGGNWSFVSLTKSGSGSTTLEGSASLGKGEASWGLGLVVAGLVMAMIW